MEIRVSTSLHQTESYPQSSKLVLIIVTTHTNLHIVVYEYTVIIAAGIRRSKHNTGVHVSSCILLARAFFIHDSGIDCRPYACVCDLASTAHRTRTRAREHVARSAGAVAGAVPVVGAMPYMGMAEKRYAPLAPDEEDGPIVAVERDSNLDGGADPHGSTPATAGSGTVAEHSCEGFMLVAEPQAKAFERQEKEMLQLSNTKDLSPDSVRCGQFDSLHKHSAGAAAAVPAERMPNEPVVRAVDKWAQGVEKSARSLARARGLTAADAKAAVVAENNGDLPHTLDELALAVGLATVKIRKEVADSEISRASRGHHIVEIGRY